MEYFRLQYCPAHCIYHALTSGRSSGLPSGYLLNLYAYGSRTNTSWSLNYNIVCNAALGSSVAVLGSGEADIIYPNDSESVLTMENTSATTGINTTIANTIKLGVTFSGTQSASNTITIEQLIVNGN